jgi:hypothetical protein
MSDIDSHEHMPAQLWEREYGPIARELALGFMKGPANNPGGVNYPNYAGDTVQITADTVWEMKGCTAPGSGDPRRRLEVMDFTGIRRQLMFPSGLALMAATLINSAPEGSTFMPGITGDRKAYGYSLLAAYNKWALRAAGVSDRLRPVVPVFGDTAKELITRTEELLDGGIRAFWLMSAIPPAGMSPAHSELDAFWGLISRHNAIATLHIGGDGGFLKTDRWGDAPAFEGYKVNVEFNLSPWHLSALHLASQNFLATMITGGVFDRHADLRFGCIELGAYWIGPLANTLDLWYENNQAFGARSIDRLPEKPSYYIKRNVRVSAFPFEKIDSYIEQYGLEDVYCYASDYPHIEGGRYSMHAYSARLERLGPQLLEKFFVLNGALLLPD